MRTGIEIMRDAADWLCQPCRCTLGFKCSPCLVRKEVREYLDAVDGRERAEEVRT